MKKNKFLKLASGLLVLCLLTTCVISTTFAKYTTSGDAQDTARVAKWGVEVAVQAGSGSETDAFYKEYDNGTNVTVSSVDKVVAPGTEGKLAEFSISGTPEVALELAIVFDKSLDVFLKAGDYEDYTKQGNQDFTVADDYYPVKYTLWKDGSEVAAAGDNLSEIVAYLQGFSKEYYITDDTTADATAWANILGTYKITWAWDFDGSGAGTYDQEDTLLGNIAADEATYGAGMTEGTDYNLTIDFKLTITATQID